jgi:hypothetical protein
MVLQKAVRVRASEASAVHSTEASGRDRDFFGHVVTVSGRRWRPEREGDS